MADVQHPLELLVRRLRVHADLSDDDAAAVRALPYQMRTLEAGTQTVREGDAPVNCEILVSGFAHRYKLSAHGARQIVAVHIPGDALDFQNLFLNVSDHFVQMLTRGELAYVARTAIQTLLQARPAVANAVFVHILVEAAIYREWIMNVGRRTARERLAHVLCEFAVRLDSVGLATQYGYELPMTQEQLADVLGLTPVHVNRTIKGLEADGLITRNRRAIAFPNWKAMREVGDFNERYLHLSPQKAGIYAG